MILLLIAVVTVVIYCAIGLVVVARRLDATCDSLLPDHPRDKGCQR